MGTQHLLQADQFPQLFLLSSHHGRLALLDDAPLDLPVETLVLFGGFLQVLQAGV
jgi:hypothetical protein